MAGPSGTELCENLAIDPHLTRWKGEGAGYFYYYNDESANERHPPTHRSLFNYPQRS